MTDIRSIPIDKIFVPERLRAVDEDHALAIQASIQQHGLLNPITVRSTPNQSKGAKPFTLVAGAHRLRAIELLDDVEIDALVVEADGPEAQLIEIEENLFRNDLSALDRAIFVQTYRDVWEQKYGVSSRGGDRKSAEFKEKNQRVNLTQLIADEAERGFSVYCAQRLGVSPETVKRGQLIARNLPKPVREKLRGTPHADNQSALLKLAKLRPEQRDLVPDLMDQSEGDLKAAIAKAAGKPVDERTPDQKHGDSVIATFGRLSQKGKLRVLTELLEMYPDTAEAVRARLAKAAATKAATKGGRNGR